MHTHYSITLPDRHGNHSGRDFVRNSMGSEPSSPSFSPTRRRLFRQLLSSRFAILDSKQSVLASQDVITLIVVYRGAESCELNMATCVESDNGSDEDFEVGSEDFNTSDSDADLSLSDDDEKDVEPRTAGDWVFITDPYHDASTPSFDFAPVYADVLPVVELESLRSPLECFLAFVPIKLITSLCDCTNKRACSYFTDKYIIIILTVTVCVIAITSIVIGLVCSIMRKKNIPLPSSLASMLTGIKPYMNVKKEDSTFSVAKHVETPNQVVEEENRVTEQIKNHDPEHETPRLKIGLNNIVRDDSIIQPEVSDLVLVVSLSDQTDVKENTELLTTEMDNKSDNSFSTVCINGYDRPHVLVEMNTDDTVEGYRPTQLD